jgi:hypothetical protein
MKMHRKMGCRGKARHEEITTRDSEADSRGRWALTAPYRVQQDEPDQVDHIADDGVEALSASAPKALLDLRRGPPGGGGRD